MMVKAEQDDLKKLLIDTITSVCREKLKATTAQFGIEGLLAITLEDDQVLLVNINESVTCIRQSSAAAGAAVSGQNNHSTAAASSIALSPVANGRGVAECSPKVQMNGNSSVLCSIVSKAPLVVAPFQIPATKGVNASTPKATLLQTTQGQTLTFDAAKHLKFSNDMAATAQTFTIDATTKNVKLGEFITTTSSSSSVGTKHKGPITSSPQEHPPQKKRLLEEHLTSNLPVVSQQQQLQQQQQQPHNTGVVSLLDNIVIKKEVLSDDEDFPTADEGPLAKSCHSLSDSALGLDLDIVGGAVSSSGSAHNGISSAAELKKMVRSDKMWNQHPVAQLSVTQLATATQGSNINLGSSSSIINGNSNSSSSTAAMYANSLPGQQDAFDYNGVSIKDEDDEDTSSYLSGNSTLEDPSCELAETDEEEFLKLARSILLYKGTFITVHSFCKVSRRTGKNAMTKISSERACWVMQKMNVPAWDEKYIGEYKELRKGTKVFFKCPPDMVNPKALAYYNVPLQTYGEGYYEESRSASFPTKTELLKRILDASPY